MFNFTFSKIDLKKNSIMDFRKPKRKKHSGGLKKFELPITDGTPIVGVFTGFNVVISDWDCMKQVYQEGYFGKGSLSKAMPVYHVKKDDIPRLIHEQQLENLSKWNSNIHYSSLKKYETDYKHNLELSEKSVNNFVKSSFCDTEGNWESWKKSNGYSLKSTENSDTKYVSQLLSPSSDSNYSTDDVFCQLVNKLLNSKQSKKLKHSVQKTEEEVMVISSDYTNVEKPISEPKVRLEKVPYVAEENLNLSLEESFFLKFAAGCLNIVDLNLHEINLSELWKTFNKTQKNFVERFVTYHYYRTKGWIVKSGLKFGGDFLLYKDGPAFYHGSYLVQVLDKRKKISWREFIAVNRMVETFNKDLVWCNVMIPDNVKREEWCLNNLKKCCVQEVMSRRWFPSKERLSKEDDL